MTEFKVGDEIRYVDESDRDIYRRVVDYVGPAVTVYSVYLEPGGYHNQYSIRQQSDHDFEVVPEVFEKGKAYKRGTTGYTRFECIFANDAIALMFTGNPGGYHVMSHAARSDYEERP